jgi:hypothetical protein
MSAELDQLENAAAQASDMDALEFYKSLTNDNREMEREIISRTLECCVVPNSVRYGIFKDVHRGVLKSTAGELYYFNYPPNGNFHLVKADTPTKEWEANKLIKSCNLGFDLIKAEKSVEHAVDEDDEDEKKADVAGLPPASRPEDQNVATQDSQVTEVHPGATTSQTSQDDGSAERWHGTGHLERALPVITQEENAHAWDTTALMKAWGQELQKTAPSVSNVDPQQRQFMIEVLGKTPNEIDSGKTKMSPSYRAQYNQWLTKSLRGRITTLSGWLGKSNK